MNCIQITRKQKEKFLEMTNKFFPTYRFTFNEGYIYVKDLIKSTPGFPEAFHVSWFEFCMTKLMCKIDDAYCEKFIKKVETKLIVQGNYPKGLPKDWPKIWENRPFNKVWTNLNGGSYKIHPIDYLYEEFKKMKL